MSMNKKIDNDYLNQYADNVLKRGFEIYDEWIDKKYNSRKIVASAHGAVKLFKKTKTMTAFVDALAYLFALDVRIKEKYNNIFRCLFAYFSWRRETRTLGSLKSELNIPLSETDIRNAIAVMIEKHAEKLENDWDEDGDDETHGGKRNGKADDEEATEEKEIEEKTEEKSEAEELEDKEEKQKDSKEKEENPIEETSQESKEEIAEKIEPAEQQKEAQITETHKKEELAQEKNDNQKEENNVSDVKSEANADKKEEVKAYNYAVDSPPLYENTVRESSSDQTSFIEEMIIDDMLRGDKNIMGYQRIDEAEHSKESDVSQDTAASQNEKDKSADKDAYLYDKTIVADKGEAQQTLNQEAEKQTEKVSEAKPEQHKEAVQNNDNVNSTKQEFNQVSETRQSNSPNVDPYNNVADALNTHMSLESKMEFIRMQEDQLREHINITLEELGGNPPVDIAEKSNPVKTGQQSMAYRK